MNPTHYKLWLCVLTCLKLIACQPRKSPQIRYEGVETPDSLQLHSLRKAKHGDSTTVFRGDYAALVPIFHEALIQKKDCDTFTIHLILNMDTIGQIKVSLLELEPDIIKDFQKQLPMLLKQIQILINGLDNSRKGEVESIIYISIQNPGDMIDGMKMWIWDDNGWYLTDTTLTLPYKCR